MRTILPGPLQAVSRRIAKFARIHGFPPSGRVRPMGCLYMFWQKGDRHVSLVQGKQDLGLWHWIFRDVQAGPHSASARTLAAGEFNIPKELDELDRTLGAIPAFLEKGETP